MSRAKSKIPNLVAEMHERNITPDDIGSEMYMSRWAILHRIRGENKISIGEAVQIQEMFFPDKDIKWLFEGAD